MINYEPKVRREVARELARILEEADDMLIDDVAINLTDSAADRLANVLNDKCVVTKTHIVRDIEMVEPEVRDEIEAEVLDKIEDGVKDNPTTMLSAIK
jgi:hypothetical protein|tara:strand:- start:3883 stop:4176 length:294 start_codon:yes stop_codon:yes gene_type:complete